MKDRREPLRKPDSGSFSQECHLRSNRPSIKSNTVTVFRPRNAVKPAAVIAAAKMSSQHLRRWICRRESEREKAQAALSGDGKIRFHQGKQQVLASTLQGQR